MPLEKSGVERGPGPSRTDSWQCMEDEVERTSVSQANEQDSPVVLADTPMKRRKGSVVTIDVACGESEEEGEITDDDYLEIIDVADDLSSEEEGKAKGCEKTTGKRAAKKHRGKRRGRARNFNELRLEDYVPECSIESLEKRDNCSLAITMKYNARSVDLTELSGDIVKLVFRGRADEGSTMTTGRPSYRHHGTTKAFARYLSPAIAAANMKRLQKHIGTGKVLGVEKCVTRKTTTVRNMLDIFRLPCDCSVRRLKEHFPRAQVLIIKNGFARLEFDSVEDVRRALKRPGCTFIDGHPIRFSLVKVLPGEDGAGVRDQYRSGGGDSGPSSSGRRGWHGSRASWHQGWRGEDSHGSRYFWNRCGGY
ncbi:uncharacterized protein LOC144106905 [Amblyomma americanum]